MKEHVVAALSGSIGGALGYVAGFGAIGIIEPRDAGLDWIAYWLMAGAIGTWLGALAGIAAGFRIMRASATRSPVFWTVLALLPFLGATTFVAVSFNDTDDNMPLVIEYALGLSGFIAAVWFGVWMARRSRGAGGGRSVA